MIRVGIIMDAGNRSQTSDIDSNLVLEAIGGEGKTHTLFWWAADNFISAIRASSVVCVPLSTNLIKEVAVRAAQHVSTVSRSTRSLAPESPAVTL